MLVITRKAGESVVIGDNIEISIVDIQRGSVRISIDAPRDISIFRKELIREVAQTNIEASKNAGLLDLDAISEQLRTQNQDKQV